MMTKETLKKSRGLMKGKRFIIYQIYFFIVPFLIGINVSDAQVNHINHLNFTGNSKTKSSYLQRFIDTRIGELPDSNLIDNDLRKLRTLPGIKNVYSLINKNDSGQSVTFQVEERITILPVGDFGITDDNFWIGFGAMESNLAGRGMYIYGYYRYNIRHTMHFIFRNQYIRGSKFGLEFQFKNLPTTDIYQPDIEYNNEYLDISLSGLYELKYENDICMGLSYRWQRSSLKYNKNIVDYSDSAQQRKALTIFSQTQFQHLDYHDFYIEGWRNRTRCEVLLPLQGQPNTVFILFNELKYFKRFGLKGNSALRLMTGISNEKNKVFAPYLADSYYNLRGIGYRAERGSAIWMLNIEHRQTLYENSIGGIQAIVFLDTGSLKKTEQELNDLFDGKNIRTYGGLGIRCIYKKMYNAILSIDYGVNLQNYRNGGWIISIGQFF